MKRLLLAATCLASLTTSAQRWERRVGLNLLPLVARTIELSTEFSPKPAYAFTLNAGYTDRTSFNGIVMNLALEEGVRERKTSGGFFKIGGKVFWRRRKMENAPSSFTTGIFLMGSSYKIQALVQDRSLQFSQIEKKGFLMGGGVSLGLATGLNRRVSTEVGLQFAALQPRPLEDYIGKFAYNYQPGLGTPIFSSDVLVGVQLYCHLKYRLSH